jgi:hypothetical protein
MRIVGGDIRGWRGRGEGEILAGTFDTVRNGSYGFGFRAFAALL